MRGVVGSEQQKKDVLYDLYRQVILFMVHLVWFSSPPNRRRENIPLPGVAGGLFHRTEREKIDMAHFETQNAKTSFPKDFFLYRVEYKKVGWYKVDPADHNLLVDVDFHGASVGFTAAVGAM
jgi:hypothetical protein